MAADMLNLIEMNRVPLWYVFDNGAVGHKFLFSLYIQSRMLDFCVEYPSRSGPREKILPHALVIA